MLATPLAMLPLLLQCAPSLLCGQPLPEFRSNCSGAVWMQTYTASRFDRCMTAREYARLADSLEIGKGVRAVHRCRDFPLPASGRAAPKWLNHNAFSGLWSPT